MTLGASGVTAGSLAFASTGGGNTTIQGSTAAIAYTLVFPSSLGSSGQVLQLNAGAGILGFATAAGGGKVKQMVSTVTGALATGTTIMPRDDTIPQNTEGDQYMSLAITPTSATNNLLIKVVWNGACSATSIQSLGLFQDTTANALAAAFVYASASNTAIQVVLNHTMVAGTTSATTFKVRVGSNGASTTTFNGEAGARIFGGAMASSIVIMEIEP